MSKNLGILREPRACNYEPDGRGRDHFIMYNNGGFGLEKLFSKIESTAFHSPINHPLNQSPKQESVPPRYQPDGSGRDTYITLDPKTSGRSTVLGAASGPNNYFE